MKLPVSFFCGGSYHFFYSWGPLNFEYNHYGTQKSVIEPLCVRKSFKKILLILLKILFVTFMYNVNQRTPRKETYVTSFMLGQGSNL
jgi:hypothetical protein